MSRIGFKQYGNVRLGPERALVKQSAVWLRQSLPSSYGWLGFDVPVGSGVPDIAFVSYSKSFENRFRPEAVDADLLAFIRSSGETALESMVSRFRNSVPEEIESRLSKLAYAGLISSDNGRYTLGSWWGQNEIKLVTIEAKVSHWKKAVAQAHRNRLFSTHTFVALPENVAERVKNEPEWRAFAIGLLSIHPDGDVECLLPGEQFVPSLWSYYYSVILDVVRFPKGMGHAI